MEGIYFNTINEAKRLEVSRCFDGSARPLRFLSHPVTEILELDLSLVVRAKAAEAYRALRVPLVVEHGGLFIDHLKGLPGPLVKPMWGLLKGELCMLVPEGVARSVTARSAVCYCDGRTRVVFLESMQGTLAMSPRGNNGYHWDPIFIPEGSDKTFAEMSLDDKLTLAPSARVYAALRRHLGA